MDVHVVKTKTNLSKFWFISRRFSPRLGVRLSLARARAHVIIPSSSSSHRPAHGIGPDVSDLIESITSKWTHIAYSCWFYQTDLSSSSFFLNSALNLNRCLQIINSTNSTPIKWVHWNDQDQVFWHEWTIYGGLIITDIHVNSGSNMCEYSLVLQMAEPSAAAHLRLTPVCRGPLLSLDCSLCVFQEVLSARRKRERAPRSVALRDHRTELNDLHYYTENYCSTSVRLHLYTEITISGNVCLRKEPSQI